MLSPRRFVVSALALVATTTAVRAGDPEMTPLPQRGPVLTVAFSPDGKRIATCADKIVRVFDLHTGREAARLDAATRVGGIAFSPDGGRLAGVLDGENVQVWDVFTAKVVWKVGNNYHSDARGVAFSSDGQRIAAVREANVCSCDAVGGRLLLVTSFGGRITFALA